MKKIPCLFERDFCQRPPRLLPLVTPGCEWVTRGEGIATRKWDGTACAIIGGELYARLDCRNGRIPPGGAIPCGDPDPVTGHWPHWIRADRPEDVWIRAARLDWAEDLLDGTYEAIGPKIGANHEHVAKHQLRLHGADVIPECPRSFDGLRAFLVGQTIEGVVFHHADGRKVKLRRDDYGFDWPIRDAISRETA